MAVSRKKSTAKKAPATEPAAPRWKPAADTAPAAGSGPPVHSIGKTWRLRDARLCPGGNSLDGIAAVGDGCGRCPTVADCTVARYNPEA